MSITAPPATGHQVHVRAAVKRYGAATALAGIDLEVPAGKFAVLLGPSGSGKSTLARVLAGVERLDSGEIDFGARRIGDGRAHVPPERRDLAMVFQDYALWPHLTVLGNVRYALRRRKLSASEERLRAGEVLERVGLAGKADRYPHQLSGGEQQRVALARAVVAKPGLLLFDEPLSNLDADLRERLRVEISTLVRESGATAVYITHDQSEAFALADVIGVLDHGRLAQWGPPEVIYRRPATPFVARFTGLAGELTGLVTQTEGEFAVVRTGDHRLRARVAGPLKTGESVQVLVRPAATRILADDAVPAEGIVSGTVVDVAYRGRGYDHVVTGEYGTLTAVFDEQARPRGTKVQVALAPDGCVVHATGAE
ncbi:MAG: iron(III) transport system ATP-binding protein [Kribbellaceae bacterium]|nr:iron(III) transport system ATP-binding protein [Kribbellaceae bacterium]